jgi:Holliday junction resolvase YEN1
MLTDFLVDWRTELRTLLRTDPDGHIGQQCKSLANNVCEMFPSPQVVLLYTHPFTSWSHGGSGAAAIPPIHLREPDLRGLASFCTRRFGWNPDTLHAKFRSMLWEGAYLKMLSQVSAIRHCHDWHRLQTHIQHSPMLSTTQVCSHPLRYSN